MLSFPTFKNKPALLTKKNTHIVHYFSWSSHGFTEHQPYTLFNCSVLPLAKATPMLSPLKNTNGFVLQACRPVMILHSNKSFTLQVSCYALTVCSFFTCLLVPYCIFIQRVKRYGHYYVKPLPFCRVTWQYVINDGLYFLRLCFEQQQVKIWGAFRVTTICQRTFAKYFAGLHIITFTNFQWDVLRWPQQPRLVPDFHVSSLVRPQGLHFRAH